MGCVKGNIPSKFQYKHTTKIHTYKIHILFSKIHINIIQVTHQIKHNSEAAQESRFLQTSLNLKSTAKDKSVSFRSHT
jgi:hypothetical protein